MKRSSIDAGPPLKRQASDHSATEIGPGDVAVLRHQNRSLALELVRYKRQIAESREELDMIRGRSREMESLVSAIQRAWSQVRRSDFHPLLQSHIHRTQSHSHSSPDHTLSIIARH